MTAIVTTPFRVVNAENFKANVGANSVYLAIGKADVWSSSTSDLTDTTPFTPNDRIDDINESYQNLLGMKKVTSSDIAHVIPRNTWASGTTYVAWDSDDATIYDEPFYVITSEFKVYKCIVADGNSEVQPTQTNTAPTAESDGYVWKYMYAVTVTDAEKFLTVSYMPVQTLAESPVLADTHINYSNQASQINSRAPANAAGIERIEVTSGGSGYSNGTGKTGIVFTGDGASAAATATVEDGAITSIQVTNKGTDYTVADITFDTSGTIGGGSDAAARAVIAPPNGHGTDPIGELGGFYIGINVQLAGSETPGGGVHGDLAVGQDFRQISLIKNPQYHGGTTTATATTLRATKYLKANSSGLSGTFVVDQLLSGGTSGAKAYLAEIDTSNGFLYYYQNSKTGYKPFVNAETVTGTLPSGGSVVLHASNGVPSTSEAFDGSSATTTGIPEVKHNSGQVVFLENRDPISRSSTQIEDVKLIIEF